MGDHSQVLKVIEGHVQDKYFGGSGPLPGPEGARKDMYGTAYVPTYYTGLRTSYHKTYNKYK